VAAAVVFGKTLWVTVLVLALAVFYKVQEH
jgi:hypothetical protein